MFYVYEFVDPRDESCFYVGKGVHNRINDERPREANSYLFYKIKSIRKLNLREQRKILKKFDNEEDAYAYEAERIKEIGLENLTNILPGGGNQKAVKGSSLLGGNTKSCGCYKKGQTNPNYKGDYLVNRRVGRLVVLSRAGKQKGGYHWLCQCDCGNQKEILGSQLTSEKTKSCGCLRKKRKHNG